MPADLPEPVIESSDAFDRSTEGRAYWQEQAAVDGWIDAGAPSPMAMWLELTGRPTPKDDRPLTVDEAAKREGLSTKSIRRRLHDLAAQTPPGAYKVGSTWRIVPAALDGLHELPARAPEPARARSRKPAVKRTSPTRWEV
jgi:hypothetical protein